MGALETSQEEFYSSEVLAPWQDPGPGGCLEAALMLPSAGLARGLPIAHQSPGTLSAFVITIQMFTHTQTLLSLIHISEPTRPY